MNASDNRDKQLREDNHTILVQLQTGVADMGSTLTKFMEAQGKENKALHERIDDTNKSFSTAVSSIKDSIAERSRMTPALGAMILSSLAIIGGMCSAYIGLRTDGLRADINHVSADLIASGQHRRAMDEKLVEVRVDAAKSSAAQDRDLWWITHFLDKTILATHGDR